MIPNLGDHFLNEEGLIFEIIDILPSGEYRCSRPATFSSNVMTYIRFGLSEIIPEKQGSFWILTIEAMEKRLHIKAS